MTVELEEALVGGALELTLAGLLRRRLESEVYLGNITAGSEWSYQVPGDTLLELVSVYESFVTSATAATRIVNLAITDPQGQTVAVIPPALTQAASLTYSYLWAERIASLSSLAGTESLGPLSTFALPPGWTIASQTTLLKAGDQHKGVCLIVRPLVLAQFENQAQWIAKRL